MYFNKNLDIAACTVESNCQITLVYRLFGLFRKKGGRIPAEYRAGWRELLMLLLLHRFYGLFLFIYKTRLRLAEILFRIRKNKVLL